MNMKEARQEFVDRCRAERKGFTTILPPLKHPLSTPFFNGLAGLNQKTIKGNWKSGGQHSILEHWNLQATGICIIEKLILLTFTGFNSSELLYSIQTENFLVYVCCR